jgi:hypothetical protein
MLRIMTHNLTTFSIITQLGKLGVMLMWTKCHHFYSNSHWCYTDRHYAEYYMRPAHSLGAIMLNNVSLTVTLLSA